MTPDKKDRAIEEFKNYLEKPAKLPFDQNVFTLHPLDAIEQLHNFANGQIAYSSNVLKSDQQILPETNRTFLFGIFDLLSCLREFNCEKMISATNKRFKDELEGALSVVEQQNIYTGGLTGSEQVQFFRFLSGMHDMLEEGVLISTRLLRYGINYLEKLSAVYENQFEVESNMAADTSSQKDVAIACMVNKVNRLFLLKGAYINNN